MPRLEMEPAAEGAIMTDSISDEPEILYVKFVSHFLGNHNSDTAHNIALCGCVAKLMDDTAKHERSKLLTSLLEKKQPYLWSHVTGQDVVDAVAVSDIKALLQEES
jgi:hypothetical protein